jgi:disulfide oxidoreductase YuzD
MAAESKHNGDIANWILKIVKSCETRPQLNNARKLMSIFRQKLDRENLDYPLRRGYIDLIQNELDLKLYEFIEKLKKPELKNESVIS